MKPCAVGVVNDRVETGVVPRVALAVWMQVVVSAVDSNAVDIACALHGCRYLDVFLQPAVPCKS